MATIFHLALNITDLETARRFYGDILGCTEGRSTATWVDFSFFGHQLSLHLGVPLTTAPTGKVGEHMVPMPHFGVVLPLDDWRFLADRLRTNCVSFVIPPSIRFAGEPGEQHTMFFVDPFGNPLEIKGFRDMDRVYAR
ncbi:MAG: VOC family protein [Pseudomonadota bacterium]